VILSPNQSGCTARWDGDKVHFMTRGFIILAFACLTPMLFVSLNENVHPGLKVACKLAFGILLVAALSNYVIGRMSSAPPRDN
jgi:hypothetical protein